MEMDVTDIPFNRFIHISHSNTDDSVLNLVLTDNLKNHLGTFHASAQFALAEASSGLALQRQFPHLVHSVVPVLRKSDIKFRKVAQSDIHTKASITPESIEHFEKQFQRRGRGTIEVSVEVIDQCGTITMTGIFEWFVQKLESAL